MKTSQTKLVHFQQIGQSVSQALKKCEDTRNEISNIQLLAESFNQARTDQICMFKDTTEKHEDCTLPLEYIWYMKPNTVCNVIICSPSHVL